MSPTVALNMMENSVHPGLKTSTAAWAHLAMTQIFLSFILWCMCLYWLFMPSAFPHKTKKVFCSLCHKKQSIEHLMWFSSASSVINHSVFLHFSRGGAPRNPKVSCRHFWGHQFKWRPYSFWSVFWHWREQWEWKESDYYFAIIVFRANLLFSNSKSL